MMGKLETRFIVNINDLRSVNRALAENVVHDPINFVPILESTLHDVSASISAA